jgi:hypothetical protein
MPVAIHILSAVDDAVLSPPAGHRRGRQSANQHGDSESQLFMTQTRKRQWPATYRFRIDGHLDSHWSPWFGGLTLAHEEDGTTSLTGSVSDQARLHGLLTKIRDLGVTLISLAVVDSDSFDPQTDPSDAHHGS